MKVLPFILAKKEVTPFHITSINLFLAHAGKSVWKTEESGNVSLDCIVKEYCEPNGIYIVKAHLDTNTQTAYVLVDSKRTNVSEFYTWEEALQQQSKPECWRRFYFIQDTDGANWWSPEGLTETEIQDYGNIANFYKIIQAYFETPKNN